MYETPATKSIKRLFTNILEGSEHNLKFSDYLAKYSVGDKKYNSKQVLDMLRSLKKVLRDGNIKSEKENGFVGIKAFVKDFGVNLLEAGSYQRLENSLIRCAETYARLLQENVHNILVDNNKLRHPLALTDSKVISPKALNDVLKEVTALFKQDLYNEFREEVANPQVTKEGVEA